MPFSEYENKIADISDFDFSLINAVYERCGYSKVCYSDKCHILLYVFRVSLIRFTKMSRKYSNLRDILLYNAFLFCLRFSLFGAIMVSYHLFLFIILYVNCLGGKGKVESCFIK